MGNKFDTLKRVLVGRPMRSAAQESEELPKFLALPIFASDALSSVAYAPDEILLTLALAGPAALLVSPWVALAVVVVLITVVSSYRHTVRNYGSGGGYQVATENLGSAAGLGVAAALLVDYTLTVAVSVAAGAGYLVSAVPNLTPYRIHIAVLLILLLAVVNLRGTKESGRVLAFPVYLYLGAIGLMLVVGFGKWIFGSLGTAASASWKVLPDAAFSSGLLGLGGAFLLLRAFSSGCAALTGVEAISNGVDCFRKPKAKNAAITLLLLGIMSTVMMLGVIILAVKVGVQYVEDPARHLLINGQPAPANLHQNPVISQIALVVFDGYYPLFALVAVVTGIILVMAANTAFNGFPALANVLSADGFLPNQFSTRGDRLVYSNGVIILASVAIIFVVGFNGEVTRLIQLYVVGVFISFTLSQIGLVIHFTNRLRREGVGKKRRELRRGRVTAGLGAVVTGVVLVVVLITKFTHGAWLTLLIMGSCYFAMLAVRRHYDTVYEQLRVNDLSRARTLPSRVRAIILVTSLNKPTMRAISYARATRPFSIEAVTVEKNAKKTTELVKAWQKARLPLPLTILGSAYRELLRPIADHIKVLRKYAPNDIVVVFVPEYVVDHWWEGLLHNHTAARIKRFLRHLPNVVISDVPYQVNSHAPRMLNSEVSQMRAERLQANANDLQQLWDESGASLGWENNYGSDRQG